MQETKVDVALPKFRLEYEKSLKECFQQLGINKIFCSGAQLGNISSSENILVSDIIHKAVVLVNEEGSEAAASTAVEVVAYCMVFNPEFFVDHPFLFVIYNTKNNLILFMGRVNEL
ncbi:serpin I2 [Nephila pilipes]|uniref:Serpin I2 n=2 Tax=Nephila pilipes TaxID=299642 RepID=A0A8X6TJA9_NEPPI|nr:serpin I2 [Nephila pilipes]